MAQVLCQTQLLHDRPELGIECGDICFAGFRARFFVAFRRAGSEADGFKPGLEATEIRANHKRWGGGGGGPGGPEIRFESQEDV